MVLFINPLIADHVCNADINEAQSFLDQENMGIRMRHLIFVFSNNPPLQIQHTTGQMIFQKKANATSDLTANGDQLQS
jgi:hypothetical protein